jgi:archaeal preflagellin peptidase FlaK
MYLELRIAVCACMLAIASILDLRNREIPDKVWAIFGGAGIFVLILELLDDSSPLRQTGLASFAFQYTIGIGLISAIGYATYRTGLFGGADPKALVAIAAIMPFFDSEFRLHGFTALTVLSNALLISMSGLIYNVARNTISLTRGIPIFEGISENRMKKALAFAVGFYSNSSGRFLFAMEEHDDRGRKRFRFNPAAYDEFETNAGKRWVTQALPFILYIGIGFAVTLFVGDLLALLMALIS